MCLAKLIDCFGIKTASIPEAVCLFLDFLGVEVGDQFLEFQDSRLRLKILHHLKNVKLSGSKCSSLCFHNIQFI